ncbi:MAG: hypothetical protein NTY38_12300 [Acidobacteria bacterium]|nr:hypothetical protein [Acidobacteriota bacterium]
MSLPTAPPAFVALFEDPILSGQVFAAQQQRLVNEAARISEKAQAKPASGS